MNFQDHNQDLLLNKIHFIMERVIVFDGLGEVLEYIVKAAVSLTRAEAATIRVFNLETGNIEILSGYGLSTGFLTQPGIKLSEGIVGNVVMSGEPFMTSNVENDPRCVNKELAKLEGIKAVLSVPLKTRETTIGCITTYRKEEEAFSDSELLLLSIFASQAVEAIEKTRLLNDLKKQAAYDLLTNIYNKGAVQKRLDEEIKRAERHGRGFSVIFIDIDNFKDFNDQNGHLLGDKLLADFTRRLGKHLRKNDIIGRYGGEEFVILTPETTLGNAVSLAEKLLSVVVGSLFLTKNGSIKGVSFSAGVSSYPEHGKTLDELISKADEAMYEVKRAGKSAVKTAAF